MEALHWFNNLHHTEREKLYFEHKILPKWRDYFEKLKLTADKTHREWNPQHQAHQSAGYKSGPFKDHAVRRLHGSDNPVIQKVAHGFPPWLDNVGPISWAETRAHFNAHATLWDKEHFPWRHKKNGQLVNPPERANHRDYVIADETVTETQARRAGHEYGFAARQSRSLEREYERAMARGDALAAQHFHRLMVLDSQDQNDDQMRQQRRLEEAVYFIRTNINSIWSGLEAQQAQPNSTRVEVLGIPVVLDERVPHNQVLIRENHARTHATFQVNPQRPEGLGNLEVVTEVEQPITPGRLIRIPNTALGQVVADEAAHAMRAMQAEMDRYLFGTQAQNFDTHFRGEWPPIELPALHPHRHTGWDRMTLQYRNPEGVVRHLAIYGIVLCWISDGDGELRATSVVPADARELEAAAENQGTTLRQLLIETFGDVPDLLRPLSDL